MMMIGRGMLAAAAMGAAVLLAGCNNSAPIPTSPPSSSEPASSEPTSTPSVEPTTQPPTSAPTSPTTTPARPVAGGPCGTSQLSVHQVDRGGSGMMKSDNSLQFTNIGSVTCTLHGFPTVTAVGANGVTLSKPADHDGPTNPTVTLRPGGSAVAQMLITHPEAYDESQCKPVTAKGLRIYPPNQHTALFLPEDFTVCAPGGPQTLRLQSIGKAS